MGLLDQESKKVLRQANKEANIQNCTEIDTEHLLLALVQHFDSNLEANEPGIAGHFGVLRNNISKLADKTTTPKSCVKKLPLTSEAKRVIECSILIARERSPKLEQKPAQLVAIQPIDLLLGISREEDSSAKQILIDLNLNVEELLDKLQKEHES